MFCNLPLILLSFLTQKFSLNDYCTKKIILSLQIFGDIVSAFFASDIVITHTSYYLQIAARVPLQCSAASLLERFLTEVLFCTSVRRSDLIGITKNNEIFI